MSTVSNAHNSSINGSANRKPRQLELLFPSEDASLVAVKGSGTLAAYSMKFAVVEVGTATPLNLKQRGRFKNYGIVAISDAPTETYGSGPHFILVEIPDIIEEPRLENRTYGKCIHTPVAIVGTTLKYCAPPDWLVKGEWLSALFPRNNKQVSRGRIIGHARSDSNSQEYTVYFEREGHPIVIVPPTLFFESPHTAELSDCYISPYTEEASRNWILLVRSIPAKGLRITYPVRVNQNSLVVPSVSMAALETSCNIREYREYMGEDEEDEEMSASNLEM